jgi:hypothetical protein
MPTPPRRALLAAVCVAGLAGLAACGKEPADTQPPRQIDLAPTRQAEPQLADMPLPRAEPKAPAKAPQKTPRPQQESPPPEPRVEAPPIPVETRPAAAPEPAPAAPATGTVAVGTSFAVKPAMKICTNTHKPGDRFTATLAAPLTGTNGLVVPEGSIAVLRIVEAAAGQPRDSTRLTYDILSIRTGDQTYEVSAHVSQSAPLERVNTQTSGDRAKKIGAGAAIGAIAGRVLGGNTKSTVLGGAIGAAAGAAVAASDQKVEGCLRDNGTIELVLDRPLNIRLAQAP